MSSTATSSDANRLLAAARPEIYRANAFRILGLPTTVSERSLTRRIQEIELAEKFGGSVSPEIVALGLGHPPQNEDVREAAQRLRDPETRFIDGFFWLWLEASSEARRELSRGDNYAVRTWLDEDIPEAQRGDGQALHNLAVLTHLRVLDLELLTSKQPLGEGVQRYRDQGWQDAYRYWNELLKREEFWRDLSDSIHRLNEPRIRPSFASALRASLPSLVLNINVQLAVRAAEAGDKNNADRHSMILHTSGFEPDTIDQVIRRYSRQIRQRITLFCNVAEAEADAHPEHGDRVTRELLANTQPLLLTLGVLFSSGNLVIEDACDAVANAAKKCQYIYWKQTEDWVGTLELLKSILAIAATEAVRAPILESIEVVRDRVEAQKAEPVLIHIRSVVESGETPAARLEELREDSVPRVRALAKQLGSKSEAFVIASDMLAGALRAISVELHNEEESYQLASEAISLALEFCIDSELRKRIEADLSVVKQHAEHEEIIKDLKPIKAAPGLGTINGIGCTLYGRSDEESKMHSYLTTLYFVVFGLPLFPMGRYRVIATGGNRYQFLGKARFRKVDKWHIAGFAALVLLLGLWVTVANQTSGTPSSNLSRTPSATQTPYSTSSAPSYKSSPSVGGSLSRSSPTREPQERLAPLEVPSQRNYDERNGEAERLKSEIDQAEQSLDGLKSELDSLAQEMGSYKVLIDRYAATIKRIERDRDLGSSVDQDEYERALRNHNTNVDLYNAKLAERRDKVGEYNELLGQTKANIDRYNRIIRSGP